MAENPPNHLVIPGLAEALAKESELRDRAFLPLLENIGGVEVLPFTPNHLLQLEMAMNGFVMPCEFERFSEKVAHALMFLWYVSAECEIPRGRFHSWIIRRRRARFIKRVSKLNAQVVFDGINSYLDDAFYDRPRSSNEGQAQRASSASFLAHAVDNLYGAGYPWSESDILNMPFKKLWQYMRVSFRRIHPETTLSNPSDRIANEYVAKLNREAACQT